jgi:DNA end-binding protein Ku
MRGTEELMARSIFNGVLRIDDLRVPVKLYSAVEPRPVGFRLLHASDRVPIRQRMVHPETGEEVAREDARKGLVLPGGMVVLRDEELAEIEPERTRDIEVLRFVEPARLDHRWYVRPYYLGPNPTPNGDADDYFAFARALAAEGKEGIVRWTMRNKVYRGGLRAIGDYLVLISLRSAAEIVTVAALPERSWPTPSQPELNMARQLIEMLEADLDWDEFHDRYAEEVLALVEAKAEGRVPELPAAKPKPAAGRSLAEALAASIAQIEEQRVA